MACLEFFWCRKAVNVSKLAKGQEFRSNASLETSQLGFEEIVKHFAAIAPVYFLFSSSLYAQKEEEKNERCFPRVI